MTRRAVVIASNGPAGGLTPLKYALADARRLAETLAGPLCRFEVELIPGAPTPSPVRDCVDRIADECAPDDAFLVAFSGHGIVDRGMLLMLDQSNVDRPLQTMLHAEDIVRAMRFCRARHKLLILDCCHAGGVLQGNIFKDAAEKMTSIVGLDAGGEADAATFAALLASDRFEKARELDALGGSFLIHEICQALGPAFRGADYKGDGAIDLDDLKWWLELRTEEHNKRHPEAKVPMPYLYGRTKRRFYLTLAPSAWIRHGIEGPNGTELLVLPAYTDGFKPLISAWCIGRTPVTNDQYRRFVEETGVSPPRGEVFIRREEARSNWVDVELTQGFEGWVGPFEPWRQEEFSAPDQPVVCISFDEADMYARWLTRKSGDGHRFRVTPRNVWDIAAMGKDFQVHDRREWRQAEIHNKAEAPAPVSDAESRTTPFGAVDMLGNVWEWCSSERVEQPVLSIDPIVRAVELRGGSYLDDLSVILPYLPLSSVPGKEECRHSDLGFRVAVTVPIADLPPEVAERVLRGFDLTPHFGHALGYATISQLEARVCVTVGNGGGDIVGRDKITGAPSAAELDPVLRPVIEAIGAAPAEVRAEAEAKLAALKQEAAKGKDANDGTVAKLVDGLVGLVPAAASAVVSAFTTPILGGIAGPATGFVLDKLRGK